MGWFTSTPSHHRSSSSHHYARRPAYARSYTGSSWSSVLGGGGGSHRGRSSSYYRRRPRDGYISYLMHKLRMLLRDLYYYARRHPFKVVFMVIMPLLSGGVLHRFARQLGIRLPEVGHGHGARHSSGGGYYGSRGYDDRQSGLGTVNSLADGIGGLAGMAKMARAFM